MAQNPKSEKIARTFAEAFIPSEYNSFRSYLNNPYWALDHCAALMAGLNPDCYKNGKSVELGVKEHNKRARAATHFFHQLLDDINQGNWRKHDLIAANDAIYVCAWKCI